MKKELEIVPNLALAGAEEIKDDTVNMPEQMGVCIHTFQTEKTILTRNRLFNQREELLAVIVYCKKCGRLGSSSRIKF